MNEIVNRWKDEELQFIKDSEKGIVSGVCVICSDNFPMQFGHDDRCKKCKEMTAIF